MSIWSRIIKPFQDARYETYLAHRAATKARQCLLSSRNWDGSEMHTRKRFGKPLIKTGRMLNSIAVARRKVTVGVPYADTAQAITGNTFIQKPTPQELESWHQDYSKKYGAR